MLTLSLLLMIADPAGAKAAEPAAKDLVCRHEKQTNSRFTKKVCRSRAAMEAKSLQDGKMLEETRAGASQCTLGATGGPGGC